MIKPSENVFSPRDAFTVPNTVEIHRNSTILLNHHEIPLIGNENSDNLIGLKNRTNKIMTHRIFPLVDDQVYKNMTRNRVNDAINRPVPLTTRSTVPLRTSGFVDFHAQDRESFHCSIGRILTVAQFFGIFPLAGVNAKSPKSLAFKIYDPRTIYAFLIILLLVFMAIFSVGRVINAYDSVPGEFDASGHFSSGLWVSMFYGDAFLNSMFFMWLAPRWKKIQEQWRAMEQLLDRGKQEPTRLRLKFKVITTLMMMSALLEHVTSLLIGTPLETMFSSSNVTFNNVVHAICLSYHPHLITTVGYNLPLGIAIVTVISIANFGGNFMNLFVLLVSRGLGERYKTLNKNLQHEICTRPGRIVWSEFRECYATLSKLVKNVDQHISPLILLSFLNNVYFSCLQLLLSISANLPTSHRIYYFTCFVFAFSRVSAVTLVAGQINTQSKIALPDIYLCPESAYDCEAQRLQQQLSFDEVCLTGMQFFPITRNFFMAIVGTIVTYEVLLLNTMK